MKRLWIGLIAVIGFMVIAPAKDAKADDCLEVGWRDNSGNWTYYRAWVDAYEERGRVHIKYDFHHGELELKVFEKERGDGADVIVLRGRWFEGRDAQRSGRVRLEMERGHHTAHGWYTQGDREDGAHYDFKLRDCRR